MSLRKNTKRGGNRCSYANITDNYNLLEDAIKQVKMGGCEYADINTSYMLNEPKVTGGRRNYKKGGDLFTMGQNLLQQTTNILNQQQQQQSSQLQASTVSQPQPLKVDDTVKQGGCGCGRKNLRKGGAVELAPFAAAVALLAARYMVDEGLMTDENSSRRTNSRRKKINN